MLCLTCKASYKYSHTVSNVQTRPSIQLLLYNSCYIMKADGAINFIDHNFLWVSPIMARVAGMGLPQEPNFTPIVSAHKKTIPEN